MATYRHTVDNMCSNCSCQSSNGYIRNRLFFCSEACFDQYNIGAFYEESPNDDPPVHDPPVREPPMNGALVGRDLPMRGVLAGRDSPMHGILSASDKERYYAYSTPHHDSHYNAPCNRQCNYCFDRFDTCRTRGIEYGPMWFCSHNHFTLANPRPKAVIPVVPHMVPLVAPLIAPQVLHHLPHMQGVHFIGGPHIMGPFFRPF